jgi:hypothetical protein
VPQPQHSWPWEPRTPGTNSGSWTVTIPSLSKDSKIHRNELVKIVQNGDQQWQPSKAVMDNIDTSSIFTGQNLTSVIPPLMSLTLTRKEKRKRKKTRKVKKNKKNDLRLLLDEKNTQKQSENFVFCTKDILL